MRDAASVPLKVVEQLACPAVMGAGQRRSTQSGHPGGPLKWRLGGSSKWHLRDTAAVSLEVVEELGSKGT